MNFWTHYWNKTMVLNEQMGYTNDNGNNEKNQNARTGQNFVNWNQKTWTKGWNEDEGT